MAPAPMSWLEAVILGLVQGLTEFLPVSSSAHLRIVAQVGWDNDPGAAFTAVTQLGTELAVLIFFFAEIWRLLRAWLVGLVRADARDREYRLAWYVIVGSIPIGILGLLFQDAIETSLRSLWITATVLVLFALILAAAEHYSQQRRGAETFSLRDGVIMGLAQSLALIPGVSRSGGTITAGLLLGLERAVAVRFSFLLALPAVFASGLFTLKDVTKPAVAGGVAPSGGQLLVATVIAFVVGYASIAWLLRYVENHTIYVFVWYRVLLGLLLLLALTGNMIDPFPPT